MLRGRPKKFADNPRLRKAVVKLCSQYGLTKTQQLLASKGVRYQRTPGKPSVTEKVQISLVTLASIAKEDGVTFTRGRPKQAA